MYEFLPDNWYVAGYSDDFDNVTPKQIFLLGQPLVVYRTSSGQVVALKDICPHRFAPLSKGKVKGDNIECGYHGFQFGMNGKCRAVPGTNEIQEGIRVNNYRTQERWGLIFIWMGKKGPTEEKTLPPLHYFDDPDWVGCHGMLEVDGNYTLLRDNLTDLTHAKYLHGSTLATDDVTEFPVEVESTEEMVIIKRRMENIERSSPFMHMHADFNGRVTHWQEVNFYPPYTVIIKVGVQSVERDEHHQEIEFRILNVLTPSSRAKTNYYWSVKRNFKLDNHELSQKAYEANLGAFMEDKEIIEAQQNMMNMMDDSEIVPIIGPHDKGLLQVTRLMDQSA